MVKTPKSSNDVMPAGTTVGPKQVRMNPLSAHVHILRTLDCLL